MAGFLRFAAFFCLLLAAFVLVGLPLLLSPLLTQMVRNTGLEAQTLDVTVGLFDPTLMLGRARRVSLDATDVVNDPVRMGGIDLSVGDADYFDRSFQTVSGTFSDVSLTLKGGQAIHVASITLDGPADTASATAHLSADDADQLVRVAGKRAGVNIERVEVGGSAVNVTIAGVQGTARLAVSGGALVLDPGDGGAIVLLQPAPSDPWTLQEAWVDDNGLNLRATVDFELLAKEVLRGG